MPMGEELSELEIHFLVKHEQYLDEVLKTITSAPEKKGADLDLIHTTIAQIKEEIKVGKEEDLGGLFYQLNLQYQLASRYSQKIKTPDLNSPYFGYMRIVQNGESKDIFLGHTSFIEAEGDFRIVDWKKAPISRIFYDFKEGENFELELPKKVISGVVEESSILTIYGGKIHRVDRAGKTYVKKDGKWINLHKLCEKFSGGQGSATRKLGLGASGFSTPDVLGLLDRDQYAIVQADATRPLLITGGAGSGKTTVALYRIAQLCSDGLAQSQALVLVPHKGLIKLSHTLLSSVGIEKVNVKTSSHWIELQARKVVADLPKRLCLETPEDVRMVKRHPAMLTLLGEHIGKLTFKFSEQLLKLDDGAILQSVFNEFSDQCLLIRLKKVEKLKNIQATAKFHVEQMIHSTFFVWEDLLEVLSDKKLLMTLTSQPEISGRMVERLLEHTNRQLKERDESSKTKGIDSQSVEAQTNFDLAQTVDGEDFALCLKLLELKTSALNAPKGRARKFKHIVLDEAQELSSVELQVISKFLAPGGQVTVAGDSAQQIDKTTNFISWDHVLSNLGAQDASASELAISYRSPSTIVEFSHHILGPLAPTNLPSAGRVGSPVRIDHLPHLEQACLVLYEALSDLVIAEPKASIAIICNEMKTAGEIYSALREIGPVRLIVDFEFNFQPGIDISTVDQVKGLEFDYVVIPDANIENYPVRNRTRKRLYLAATRAIHQLWVLYSGEKSHLI
jgi:DNA helicase II / ATP-dependent DNA helicase PcrA